MAKTIQRGELDNIEADRLQPDEVRILKSQEKSRYQRLLVEDAQKAERVLFSRIHDSVLGLAIAEQTKTRLVTWFGGDIQSADGLSKLATSVSITTVKKATREFIQSGRRSLDDPVVIYEHGGICFEASTVANATAHLAYALSASRPSFDGYTELVVLRNETVDGDFPYHAVCKLTTLGVDGAETARFSDPINNLEGLWEDFMSGEAYADLSSRPVEIVGSTAPINLMWNPSDTTDIDKMRTKD